MKDATVADGADRRIWRGQRELETLLPRPRPIQVTSGIDRYGFSHVLAARCGLPAPPRSFANWVHGWIWDEAPNAESLHCAQMPRDVPVVVRNDVERRALREEGFRHVTVGGLPFAYVPRQHASRNPHALLAIPPHSAEVERLTCRQQDYMDYLESIRDRFDGVYISIFHLDWEGPMHRAALARGLRVVPGARPDDANSLARTRALFDAFDQVTTNTIGSHLPYALHAGCRFSFCGPMFVYDGDTLLGNGNPIGHREARVRRLVEIQSPAYLRARFGRYFVDSPADGLGDRAFGSREVGTDVLLGSDEIKRILGWSPWGQLAGYASGAIRRLGRRACRSR